MQKRILWKDNGDGLFRVHCLNNNSVIVAEFSTPTESFALREALPKHPEVSVEADRMAAHVPGSTLPCIWTTGGDADGFDDAIAEDPTVHEIFASADFDGERLYHIGWNDEIKSLVRGMIDHQGVILEATASDDRWRFRIRFMTRDQFSAFRDHFDDSDGPFTLERLLETQHPRHTRGDVSPAQYEALRTAAELGYFQVPRQASIREVADSLGVSHQTISERLRRGTENLVNDMLAIEPIQAT